MESEWELQFILFWVHFHFYWKLWELQLFFLLFFLPWQKEAYGSPTFRRVTLVTTFNRALSTRTINIRPSVLKYKDDGDEGSDDDNKVGNNEDN